MSFDSTTFLIFFAVVWVLQRSIRSWTVRKWILLVASYLFYAAWSPPFVLLLWLSTAVDWGVGRALAQAQSETTRRALVALSIAVNLGMLGYFKYGTFLVENVEAFLATFGVMYQAPEMSIVLPVGISFYTFQTLSYTLDIYFRRQEPWDEPLDFALYVTFFPQLVAGPIVRSNEFLPQCRQPAPFDVQRLGWGLFLVVFGLFEKSVLADTMFAPLAERIFDSPLSPDTISAWLGTLAFTGQIYGDFAGYSTCAIGVAMCLGFALPDNFRSPYAAIGFSDFWRRWHISLSTWLRDYVYIPSGGNRGGWWSTQRNLMLTMLLGGLWHGASWTFVVWGGLHGLLLIVERVVRRMVPPHEVMDRPIGRIWGMLLTFAAICFTWVFFRADTLDRALHICGAMMGLLSGERMVGLVDFSIVAPLMAAMVVGHGFMRNRTLEEVAGRLSPVGLGVIIAGLLLLIFATPGMDRAFIYFQF
ncbi:MAG: MBOAT family O-acyltransferase [Myxococcota bacterium]